MTYLMKSIVSSVLRASKIIIPSLLLAAASSGSAALVARYSMDETSGTTLVDSSGNGYNGRVVGGGSFNVPGIIGSGYQPGGAGSYGVVTNGASLFGITGNTPRTISLWFKTPKFGNATAPNQYRLIGIGPAGCGTSFDIVAENTGSRNQIGLRYGNGNTFYDADNNGKAFEINTWYHVAVAYDGSNLDLESIGTASNAKGLTFYVNGMEVNRAGGNAKNGTEALNTAAADFLFGTAADLVNDKYPGVLDEVRVYNTALSPAEILALANPTSPGAIASDPIARKIVSFGSNPAGRVPSGSSVTLSWVIKDAATATLNPGNIDLLPLTTAGHGSLVVKPTQAAAYTLDVTSADGALDHASVPISIGAPFPNIIVFLVDDMGWSDWNQNGASDGSVFYETPNMDKLAAQGMWFPHGYSACTVCSPSRCALLTGEIPAYTKLTQWISGTSDRGHPLREALWSKRMMLGQITIPEVLHRYGYRTIHVGKWHLGESAPEADPLNQGFDIDIGGNQAGHPPGPECYFASANGFSKLPNLPPSVAPAGSYLTDVLTEQAEKQISAAAAAGQPFFLYMSHYAVHTPLQAPADTIQKYDKKKTNNPDKNWQGQTNSTYAAMIEHVDKSLGALINRLRDPYGNPATNDSIAENTLIVFTSDNGGLTTCTSNRPLRKGKGGEYDGGVREPVVFWWPGKIASGTVCNEPVISYDFYPTFLSITGIPGDPAQVLHGQDLSPLLFGSGNFTRSQPLVFHYPHYSDQGGKPYSALRDGKYKCVYLYETGTFELYDVISDPGETNNLASALPEINSVLSHKLSQRLSELDANYPRDRATLSALPPVPQ